MVLIDFLPYFVPELLNTLRENYFLNMKKFTDEAEEPIAKYSNNQVSIISNLKLNHKPQSVYQLEAFVALLCTEGEGYIFINNCNVHLQKHDLMVCPPGTLLEIKEHAPNFNGVGFYLSKGFIEEINNIPTYYLNVRLYLNEHPVMHLSEQAGRLFYQYYNLIASKLSTETPLKHHRIITSYLLQAFMYEFHDTLESTVEPTPAHFTSGENLYNQFLELVMQSYPKSRSVAWYADRLNVSPKYLSATCKNACGQTALKLIDRYVTEDVKRMLMRPEKSIKEIVAELEFPSISFFGKYVKKHLGMAPKHYRQELCRQAEEE